MSAWPPTDNNGRLDRRAADVRLLVGLGTPLRHLVDLDSAHAEIESAITAPSRQPMTRSSQPTSA